MRGAEADGFAERVVTVTVVGPTAVTVGDDEIVLRPRERAVVSAIAFDHPRRVSADRIVELMWGDHPPPTARKAVHNHVARLRRQVPDLVDGGAGGYALGSSIVLDVVRPDDGHLDATGDETALADETFPELANIAEVVERRLQLHAVAAANARRRITAGLERGDHAPTRVLAEALLAHDPHDEQVWGWLATLDARAGRRRAALQTIQRARTELRASGLEIGAELRGIERRIVADDSLAVALAPHGELPAAMPVVGLEPVGIALREAFETVEPGRAVLLTGAAGAGKTTVMQRANELLRVDQRSTAVFRAACAADPTTPLQPIVDLLVRVAARHPDHLRHVTDAGALGRLAPRLSDLIGTTAASADHHRLLDAVAAAFATLPGDAVVIVDDVHWAPPLTARALARIGSIATPRLRVLFAARPDEVSATVADVSDTVALPAWSVDLVESWLSAVEPDLRRRRPVARWLHGQTAGTPMFVRELTLAMLTRNTIGPAAPPRFVPPDSMPGAITTALAARVRRLSADGIAALEAAAVLGTQCDADHLRAMLGRRVPGIDEAIAAGMLRPDGAALAFEHQLLHRVVSERLSAAASAELHDLALGTAVADDATAGELDALARRARHALGAAALDPERAVAAASRAATAAAATYARREAGELWLAAADHASDACQRLAFRVAAGRELSHAGDPRSVSLLVATADEALDAGLVPTAAEAVIALCRVGPATQGHPDAVRLYQAVLPQLEDDAMIASLCAAATAVHSLNGEAARCRELIETALAAAERDGADETIVEVLPYTYLTIAAPHDLDRRIGFADRLASAARRLDHVGGGWSALHIRFANQLQTGDPGIRRTAAELERMTPLVGEASRDWELQYVRATLAHLDGDLAASEAAITESLSFLDAVGADRVMAVYGVHLLGLRFSAGRVGELQPALAGLAADQPAIGAWHAALALAAAGAGDVGTAQAAFDRASAADAAALERDYTITAALLALGEAAILLADTRRGAVARALLAPFTGRWSFAGTCTLGPIDATLAGLAALAGDDSAAAMHTRRAVESAERLGAPAFAAWAAARGPR